MLGIMIDCSRNSVMNVQAVKGFVDMMVQMGYDTLMLYTEDTFEVNNEPYFGHMRGRYTKEELKELDAYCSAKGIELVSCIQTLAHLNSIFRWTKVYGRINDCDDILLVDVDRTYELIDHMFATISECFSSKLIHIGMDEAYKVGLGKHLDRFGYEERFDLINRHLHKVCDLADKYGMKPMIWSDMFCKLALNSGDYYGEASLEEIRKRANLPENICLMYWDYYSSDVSRYERMIQTNKAFDRHVMFAGGAWTWKGFAPDNGLSIMNTKAAVEACRNQGVTDMLFTVWGDDGGECSTLAVLPALFYTAELVRGNSDEASIKAKFEKIFGMGYEEFMLLDGAHTIGGVHDGNISKYLLYNDPFTGLMNYRIDGHENQYFEELTAKLRKVNPAKPFEQVFAYITALYDALSVKSELSNKTRQLYVSGDTIALHKLAEQEYVLAIEKIKHFHAVYQSFWFSENKPHGFDMQDIRLGGLLQRLEGCRARLLAFCAGELEHIPELEEEPLPGVDGGCWARTATPNVISHAV